MGASWKIDGESRIVPSRGEPTRTPRAERAAIAFRIGQRMGAPGGIDPSFGACPTSLTLCQSRDAALPNTILGPSECEIYPSTNHAKVVVWTIHYIPTKIVYPADMRCKANFDATAKLPDAPGFGAGLFSVKKR